MADNNMNTLHPELPPPNDLALSSSDLPQKKPTFKHQQTPQYRDIKAIHLNEVRKKVQERIELINKKIASLKRYIEIKKEMLNLLKDLEKEGIEKDQKINEFEKIQNEFNQEMAKIVQHVKTPKELHEREVEFYNKILEREREIEHLFSQNVDGFAKKSDSIMKIYDEFFSTTNKEILNYLLNPDEFRKFIEENQKILNVLRLQMQENAPNITDVLNQNKNEKKN